MSNDRDTGISVEFAQGEYSLSLKSFLGMVRRRLLMIAGVAVLLAGLAVGFSLLQAPVYEASTEIIVGQEQNSEIPSSLSTDIMGLQQVTLTVAEAVDSRVVASAVIEELDLQMTPERFLGNMSVEQVPETQFIQIYYVDSDPERAREIADTIAEVTSEQIADVSPSASAITATVWEPAVTPTAPVGPDVERNAALALALGLMLGVALALLLEYLDDSWRTPEEVERVTGVPTFTVVPEFKTDRSKKKGGNHDVRAR